MLKRQKEQKKAYRPIQNKVSLFKEEQSKQKKLEFALSVTGEKPQLFKMKKFENVSSKISTQKKRPGTAQPASKGVSGKQENVLKDEMLKELRDEQLDKKSSKKSANQRYMENEDDLSDIMPRSNVNMDNDFPDIALD